VFGHVYATEYTNTTKGLSLIYTSNKPDFERREALTFQEDV